MSPSQYRNHSVRRYTMLAAGTAGGVLLGRFLPILVANASGLVRAATGQNIFAGLIREHRQLLSLLDRMKQIPTESYFKRMGVFLKFKRTLAKHALAEEDIIYPLLQTEAERKEESQKLYSEHARMKVLLFELERSMRSMDQWAICVQNLRDEIEPHARHEEEVEFPMLQSMMNRKKLAEVSRKMYQEEALTV